MRTAPGGRETVDRLGCVSTPGAGPGTVPTQGAGPGTEVTLGPGHRGRVSEPCPLGTPSTVAVASTVSVSTLQPC